MFLLQVNVVYPRPRPSSPTVNVDEAIRSASTNKRVEALTRTDSKFIIDAVPPNAMKEYGKRLGLGALGAISGLPGLGGLRQRDNDPDKSSVHFVIKAPVESTEVDYRTFSTQSRGLQAELSKVARLNQEGVDFVSTPDGFKANSASTGAELGTIKFNVELFEAYSDKDRFESNHELTTRYGKDFSKFQKDALNKLIPQIRAGVNEVERNHAAVKDGRAPQVSKETHAIPQRQLGSTQQAEHTNVIKIAPLESSGSGVTLDANRFPYIKKLVEDLNTASVTQGIEYAGQVKAGVATITVNGNTGFNVEKIGELKIDPKKLFNAPNELDRDSYVLELRRELKRILDKQPSSK